MIGGAAVLLALYALLRAFIGEGTNHAKDRTVDARVQDVPPAGPRASVADVRARQAQENRGWDASRSASERAAAVLTRTAFRWDLSSPLIRPKGAWVKCPVCDTDSPVLRAWRFHRRPGAPSIPWRCDVHFKCRDCAAGWWHGVAIPADVWDRRPLPVGLRRWLSSWSYGEPTIFAQDRGGHRA